MNGHTNLRRAALSLLAGGTLAVLGVLFGPIGSADAATVPIDLYASTGTTTFPAVGGQSVTVWGYGSTAAPVTAPGGPVLTVDEGDTVVVTLHNQLPETTALLFQGQAMVPDRAGTAPATTKTYTFTATRPGTYLYEAGLTPNGQHQVAMGLYGALVVRSATAGQAYDDASTAFDSAAVVVLSEIDPALNNAASPATFDMRKYAPRYFLVNGKVHPDAASLPALPATSGAKVLLRYVNAGNQYHSMAVLGATQTVVGIDGSKLNHARQYVADTFGPGQTTDAIVTVPTTATDRRLAVYDAALSLHNSNQAGAGGMLTFLAVTGAGGATDTVGPAARSVALAGTTLTATLDETTTGAATVASAEFYLDSITGTGTAMTAVDGAFDSVTEGVTASVTLPTGEHVFYVRGRDALGHWGAFSSVLVTAGDATGPETTSPTLTPSLTNTAPGATVALHATANDTASGGSVIAAAEYFIDTVGAPGTGAAMSVNTAAPIASIDAVIPSSALTPLAQGSHTISVRSRDASGNWGALTSLALVVDRTGPNVGTVSAAPSPNNGTLSFNIGIAAVRITAATVVDPVTAGVSSNVAAVEAFIDTVGANGSGIPLGASDGVYNSPSEPAYANVPLSTIAALSTGTHTISVHARDAAGTWGPMSTTSLVVDKVKPVVTGLAAAPNATLGAPSVTLTATASDNLTAVTRAEWYLGTDPGLGNGTAITPTGTGPWGLSATIDVRTWSEGSYTLYVRAKDAAGNWSTPVSTVLVVSGPLSFSTFGNTNPPGVAGTADDADIYAWSGTAYSRVFDATVAGIPAAANVDGYARVDATHFYLSFAANTTVPGLGAVQDEDVVYNNAGTWSVYFNGTAHGLTTDALDVDAISVVGGTLYFSTAGNTNPPGVGGTADDADIYSWNGISYARVFDATANGIPAAANVDGYDRVDATHFTLSFAADTTVTGLGAVQDEDVIRNTAGTWSVYFDGTAHGLGAANLDIDAFDVP